MNWQHPSCRHLGRNALGGPIPTLITTQKAALAGENCDAFPNPFNKIFKKIQLHSRKQPSEISALVNLKSLVLRELSNTFIRKSIVTNIITINIQDENFLTGSLPTSLSLLLGMEELNLGKSFYVCFRQWFKWLTQIIILWFLDSWYTVAGNNLQGILHPELGKLINLRVLDLRKCLGIYKLTSFHIG